MLATRLTCCVGGHSHSARTRFCMDMRSHHREWRHERRPIVKLLEEAIKLTAEQPRDRNRSNSRMFAPDYSNPFDPWSERLRCRFSSDHFLLGIILGVE